MSRIKTLTNGIIRENPILVLVLGTCPFLAVTTQASNAIGMGAAVSFVLLCSNIMISLLRKVISDKVRIPCYIVIIASFVTIVQMIVKAYMQDLDKALGLYLPLIVVNCIILGRAEAFASKNPPLASVFDGVGMGVGFTLALIVVGLIREFLGAGTAFGVSVLPEGMNPIGIMVRAPGAFLTIAFVVAVMNAVGVMTRANKMVDGCDGCCANCSGPCEDKREEERV